MLINSVKNTLKGQNNAVSGVHITFLLYLCSI